MGQSTFTPKQIRTVFENLVDDTMDITYTYQLLTQVKNWIEIMLNLYILQTTDESQTASSGDSYTTLKTVPTDFRKMINLYVGTLEYWPVPFAQRIRYKDTSRRYYIDYKRWVAGSTALGLTGKVTGSSQTITQVYLVETGDLTEANEDTAGVILWPDEFQLVIANLAAKIKNANIDPDEINFRQALEHDREFARFLEPLIAWDHELKLSAQNDRRGYFQEELEENETFDIGTL